MLSLGLLSLFGFNQVCLGESMVRELREEFESAGIDLRLDRDEVLHSKYKIFDGFIRNPDLAFKCGVKSVEGKKMEKGSLGYFQIRPSGELRQIYPGHIVLKRRHRKTGLKELSSSRIILAAEQREKGIKLCYPATVIKRNEDQLTF